MDYIVVTDDEMENNNRFDNVTQNKLTNRYGDVESFNNSCVRTFSSSHAMNNYKDELVAIQLEINEINQETNRLRRRRCQLLDRQKELKELVKGNQQTTTNSVDQWGRTSRQNKGENFE